MTKSKDRLLELFFDFDEDEHYVKSQYHITYQGEVVTSIDTGEYDALYTNGDRERWWDWSKVKIEDFDVYELKSVDW